MPGEIRKPFPGVIVGSRYWGWLPVVLLGVLPFIASLIFPPATFRLEVEAEISAGQTLQVFFNDDANLSHTTPIIPGRVHTYQFSGIPPSTHTLRIDPGEQPGSQVRVLSARTFRNEALVKEIAFDQETNFQCGSCEQFEASADSARFIAATNDPIFFGEYIHEATLPDRLWALFGNRISTLYLKLAIVCVFLLVLMPLSPRKASHWLPGFPLLVTPVLILVLSGLSAFLSTRIVTSPDFSQAVGFSTFTGRPKIDEFILFYLCVLSSLLAAALLFAVAKTLAPRIELPRMAMPDGAIRLYQIVFLAILVSGIVVMNFPALDSILKSLATWSHSSNWDSQSITAWRYAVSRELLPYRDFWFPYGGGWRTLAPFTSDQLRFFIHCAITFGGFFTLLFLLSGGRILATLVFTSLIWWGAQEAYFQSLFRYLLPTNLLLFYLWLMRQKVASPMAYVIFGLYASWVFSYESTLAAYACLPVVLLATMQLIQNYKEPEWRAWLFRTHTILLATCMLGITAYLASLYRDGQLPGYIEFHRDMGALSVIAAVPAAIPDWLGVSTRGDTLVLALTLLLPFWGAWLILWYWKKPEQWLGIYLLLFGCLSFAIYNKYLVRPHGAHQFLVVPLAGVFLYFTALSETFSAAHKALLRLCAVFAIAALYFSPLGNILEVIKNRVHTLAADVQTLFLHESVQLEAQADFFSPRSFTHEWPQSMEIYNYIQDLKQSVDIDSMYVLGNDQYLYVLLGERPPFYLTNWEGGTQRAQMRTLADFNESPPDIMLYNPAVRSFDGVPDQVRAPRIYQYAAQNYKVIGDTGGYVVLGRRPEGEAIDYGRWGELLGQDVFLGFIPGSTSFDTLPDCTQATPDCADYLVVTLARDPGDALITLSLSTEHGQYRIGWSTRSGQRQYEVPLSRLWFWPSLADKGAPMEWTIPSTEATFERVRKGAADSVLY